MNIPRPFALLGFLLIAASASASAACIQVRGPGGHTCMEFSAAEQDLARSYGLRLGTSHAAVKRSLEQQGWKVDRTWVRAQSSSDRKGDLICGSGYDATCSTAFVRRDRHAYLTFSGTSAGTPLIAVTDRD